MNNPETPLLGCNARNYHDLSNSDIKNPDQTVVEYKPGDSPLENFFGIKQGPASIVLEYLTPVDYANLLVCSKATNVKLNNHLNPQPLDEIRSAYEALVQAKRSYKITGRITATLAFLYSAGFGFFLTKAEPNLLSDLLTPIVVIVPFATIGYGLHKMKEYERVVKATNERFNTLRNCPAIEALSGRNDTNNTMDEKKPETPEETKKPRL